MLRVLNFTESTIGKRKLIICFGVIIIIAIGFLYYESIYNLNNRFKSFSDLTTTSKNPDQHDTLFIKENPTQIEVLKDNLNNDNITKCWDFEKYTVIEECSKCDYFSLKHIKACLTTSYKEEIKCEKYGQVSRSCKVPAYVLSKRYWSFDFICFVFTVLFSSFTINRKRYLDKQAMDRMRQQILS